MPNAESTTGGPSSYISDCVDKIAQITYGKDNRRPIHDVVEYIINSSADYVNWADNIGLVVNDGKLCVSYDSGGDSDDAPRSIPTSIKNTLAKILTDPYVSQMTTNIHDTVNWGFGQITSTETAEEKLGLTVQNGKLCVVMGDDDSQSSTTDSIPAKIQTALSNILTDVNGKDLRNDIVTVLRWAVDKDYKNSDLGLSVVNGKLCIEYEEGG